LHISKISTKITAAEFFYRWAYFPIKLFSMKDNNTVKTHADNIKQMRTVSQQVMLNNQHTHTHTQVSHN